MILRASQPSKNKQFEDRNSRNEGQTLGDVVEAPLVEHRRVGLEEREDEGVTEAREERQPKHDGLADEHDEGTRPGQDDVARRELATVDLGRAVEHDLTLLPSPLGLTCHEDGRARLGDPEVRELDNTTTDELDPELRKA